MAGKKDKSANTLSVKDKALDAMLALAAAQDWNDISMADIARHADLAPDVLYDHFDDRSDLLAAYGRRIDRKILAQAPQTDDDDALSPRDRLFDLMMDRFDVLNDHRDAVTSIMRSFRCDPKQAVISLPHLGRSMSWMLETAGIATSGFKGAVKVAGLTGLYLKALYVWMNDDSPDMGKTMAVLDKNLSRAEQWAHSFRL